MVFHDPLQVVLVADGAYHHETRTVGRVHFFVRYYLYLLAVQRGDELFSDKMPLIRIVGVDGYNLAGAKQLRSGSGYKHVFVGAGNSEFDEIQFVDVVPVFHLGIGQGGHAPGAPVHREVGLVDQISFEKFHE